MGIHAALRATLTIDVGVSAVVGDRVYSNASPDNVAHKAVVYPQIVLHQISQVPTHSHGGPSGYSEYRMQLNLWGKSFDDVEQLSHLVRGVLDGYKGPMPPTGTEVATVESSFLETEDFDLDDDGEGKSLHVCRQDYLIAILQ